MVLEVGTEGVTLIFGFEVRMKRRQRSWVGAVDWRGAFLVLGIFGRVSQARDLGLKKGPAGRLAAAGIEC